MQDITLQNIEQDLIAASQQQPVLLDIWAPWCGPCKTLGPVLERLETAYAGRFALAKLNSDEQPEIAGQLSQMFGVRSIPFCVLFKDGQPVDGFVGALPESQVRAFLDKHLPSEAEAAAESEVALAESLMAQGDVGSALDKLREAVALDPANDTARYDCLRGLLTAGQLEEARALYEPVASRVVQDPRFAACGLWLEAFDRAATARPVAQLEAAVTANRRDFEARYELAQVHFAALRFTDAMDALLEILLRDKGWRDQLARKTFVAVLEVMARSVPAGREPTPAKSTLELAGAPAAVATDPVVDSYRRKLSMTIF
jgi:putative thioredoxin